MSTIINTPALEAQAMNQDVFSQLYQSLTPTMGNETHFAEPSSVFDEWLKQDFFSSECSVNSSPEIATPSGQFLMSPPSLKDAKPGCIFETDLDVSAVLDSPLPTMTPQQQMASLFADIGDSLPAALAALAAVAAPTTPVVAASPAFSAAASPIVVPSPAVTSASTPAFSTKTKKRQASEDPVDDAVMKRQKNTDAARRSRLRKVQKMETLELRVSDLEKINTGLLMRVAVLDSEKTNLKAKESSYEARIKILEEQLAEAHKALSSRS